ncbi:MAG: TolC family protein [Thermoanaerobaculia bacterium]
MRFPRRLGLAVGMILLFSAPGAAQEALTLQRALSLARERAPAVLSARARIDEARARLSTASLIRNPEVEAAAGGAISGEPRSAKVDAGFLQDVELGGRRSSRIAVAQAGMTSSIAEAEDVLRRARREVAAAFFRGLQAQERLALLAGAERIAQETLEAARRRLESGDVALLDVNVARAAAARARSEVHGARSSLSASLAEVRVLLGFSPEEKLRLEGEISSPRRFDLAELLEKAVERPDIRALESELEAANAELRLGQALAWPELGLGALYQREEGQDFLLGAVRLSLPLFDRGQGVRAEATARAGRVAQELEARRRAVRVEVGAAYEIYDQLRAAVEELQRDALGVVEENEALSKESYDVGQISLIELLLVRRQMLEIRSDYLSRLLDAAIASADLEASAGVSP